MNSVDRQSGDTEKSPRKSLSATSSSPCSCRECRLLREAENNSKQSKTPVANPDPQDHGDYLDWKVLRSKSPEKRNKENRYSEEPNLVHKSSSSPSVLKTFDCDCGCEETKEEVPLIEIFKAPQLAIRVPSCTEAIPVLRKNRRLSSPDSTNPLVQHSSTYTCSSSSCWTLRDFEQDPSNSSLEIKSSENFIQESKTQSSSKPSSGRPPLPPKKKAKGQISSSSGSSNPQSTEVIAVEVNRVEAKHLKNFHPPIPSFASPSFISVRSLRSARSSTSVSLIPKTPLCTLARTLPFSRELEFQKAGTSLSSLHGTESCTNLFAKVQLEHSSQSQSEPCIPCPLSASESGRSKISLSAHHRDMESRYLTDLEWRICHAVNIYVYRNGEENQSPILVHIPPARKKNMRHVMAVIQERMKYPIGYAKSLFKMDGQRIRHPCELEMYNNYVVATNFDKHFKCVQYGRRKSPLLVLARESKHVRVLRLQNEAYDHWLMKKKAAGEERSQFIYPPMYTQDGYGPADLPVSQLGHYEPCGPFCKLPNNMVCESFNHENCGPSTTAKPSGRGKSPDRGQSPRQKGQSTNQQNEVTVNTMTVAPGPPRNPAHLLQQKRRQSKVHVTEEEDEVERLDTPSVTPSNKPRFHSISKEDESFFYGTKPRRRSRGVIDISGERKVFGPRSTRMDYNANLLKNEYDEIPDFSDSNHIMSYQAEVENSEVADETCEEYFNDEPQQQQHQGHKYRDGQRISSQACISATSPSYTIVTKQPTRLQQGGTQTKMSTRQQPYPLRKPPSPPDIPNQPQGSHGTGKGRSHFAREGHTLSKNGGNSAPVRPKLKKLLNQTSSQSIGVAAPQQKLRQQQQARNENFYSGGSGSGLVTESSMSEMSFGTMTEPQGQAQHSQMESPFTNFRQMPQENYILNVQELSANSLRSFGIDNGGSQISNNEQYFSAAHDPVTLHDFSCQNDEFFNTLDEQSPDEIDIPYTPHEGKSRNTYQPPPNFFPPFQDYRFLPNGALSNFNGSGSFNKLVEPSLSKVQVYKPKCRNVSTQFGMPCIDSSRPTSSSKGPVGGRGQSVLQEAVQNQQLRLQNLLKQQKQLESDIQLAKNSSTQMANSPQLNYSTQVPSVLTYGGQSNQQQTSRRSHQMIQGNRGHLLQQSIAQTKIQPFIPPPTQFRDLGAQMNTQRNPSGVRVLVPMRGNVQNNQQRPNQQGRSISIS